ncbi:MAG: hypothetical protein LAP85_27065 [Acidobacteriia bacterium]|nr:hypothetical protein [Terriglobia bacterium]
MSMIRIARHIFPAATVAFVCLWAAPGLGVHDQPRRPLVVLADPADPYYQLGIEIARNEKADLVPSIDQACALEPDYLIWVVSPAHLSDRALVDYGRAVQQRGTLALGFISGSTVERARELWTRRPPRGPLGVIVAEGAMASRPGLPTLRIGGHAELPPELLSRETFGRSLRDADYVTYNGHGGAEYFRFDERQLFVGADIPPLPPLVISAFSCNTFRLWQDRSIALAFVDRGAAAYAGFSYSPMPGCAMDEGFPFRRTWPGFPIGRVVQLQARAAMLATSRFPIFHLLGDPRLALGSSPSYEIIVDREQDGDRQIEFAPLAPGAIPIRIDGGARYEVADVPGVSRVSARDGFYNGRLQMLDVGADKYLLVQHPGGPLTIRLTNRDAGTARVLLKALDLGLVVYAGGDRVTPMLIGLLGAFGILWLAFRKAASARILVTSLIVGSVFGCAHLTYAVLRMGRVDVISSPPAWTWWPAAVTLVLVALGSAVFLNARRQRPTTLAVAVAVATLPLAGPALLWLGSAFAFNFMLQDRIGAPLYNYALGTLYLLAAGMFGAAFVVGCIVARRFSRACDAKGASA